MFLSKRLEYSWKIQGKGCRRYKEMSMVAAALFARHRYKYIPCQLDNCCKAEAGFLQRRIEGLVPFSQVLISEKAEDDLVVPIQNQQYFGLDKLTRDSVSLHFKIQRA